MFGGEFKLLPGDLQSQRDKTQYTEMTNPYIIINVDLISNKYAGYVLAVIPELLVPVGQVLIGDFSRHIKH